MPGKPWRLPAEISAAAYHEAGHAVAWWRLGEPIGKVTIMPGISATGELNWGHFQPCRGGDRSIKSGWGFRTLVMTLAGAAAQRVHDPRSSVLTCAATDLRSARDLAYVMSTSRQAARALLLWAHTEARARVEYDWYLIEALAAALIDAGTMSGEAATDVLVRREQAHQASLAEMRIELANTASL